MNKKKFSPYDYWQFWRNTDDNDVVRFLKFFTEIEPVKIDDLAAKEKNINNLKRILANEATKKYYTDEKLRTMPKKQRQIPLTLKG